MDAWGERDDKALTELGDAELAAPVLPAGHDRYADRDLHPLRHSAATHLGEAVAAVTELLDVPPARNR